MTRSVHRPRHAPAPAPDGTSVAQGGGGAAATSGRVPGRERDGSAVLQVEVHGRALPGVARSHRDVEAGRALRTGRTLRTPAQLGRRRTARRQPDAAHARVGRRERAAVDHEDVHRVALAVVQHHVRTALERARAGSAVPRRPRPAARARATARSGVRSAAAPRSRQRCARGAAARPRPARRRPPGRRSTPAPSRSAHLGGAPGQARRPFPLGPGTSYGGPSGAIGAHRDVARQAWRRAAGVASCDGYASRAEAQVPREAARFSERGPRRPGSARRPGTGGSRR